MREERKACVHILQRAPPTVGSDPELALALPPMLIPKRFPYSTTGGRGGRRAASRSDVSPPVVVLVFLFVLVPSLFFIGNGVSVTSVLGGTSDNTGSSMARRLVLKTGLNIVLACNIPKDSPILEAAAERKLVEKLRSLGYIRSKGGGANTSTAH